MNQPDFSVTITAPVTPAAAFDAINRVSEWWGPDVEGHSKALHDVYTIHFGDTFATMRLTEFVPGKKVVWHVTDCYLPWLEDKTEWMDHEIIFDILPAGDATQIRLTHIGLVPATECYEKCDEGWNFHVRQGLYRLLTEGKATFRTPAPKETA